MNQLLKTIFIADVELDADVFCTAKCRFAYQEQDL